VKGARRSGKRSPILARVKRLNFKPFGLVLAATMPCLLVTAEESERKRPIDGIMDNSFLVEEAYNQESGVVQNIFTAANTWVNFSGTGDRRLDLAFTQEWPVPGQTHQLSYTVPFTFLGDSGSWDGGFNDVFLNYRYQAYYDEKSLTAFAPRFSLILPTGTDEAGLQLHEPGYQWNLPFSTTFGDRWFLHLNAGLTFLPNAGSANRQDLWNFNLGTSGIFCLSENFHLMLEWAGYWTETSAGTGRLDHGFGTVISPGARYAINLRSGAQLVIGAAVPIGLTRDTPDVGAFFYLSFESRVWGKAK
jgi:hypothetical protein